MNIVKGRTGLKAARGGVVTLGNFDGVHLGHKKILKAVLRRARASSLPSVVYTFDPHPLKVVSPEKCPPLIMTFAEKARIIGCYGIDHLVAASFTKEFAAKDPREFVTEVIVGSLGVRELFVGHDYAFGKGKRGTLRELKKLAAEFGFSVTVIPAHSVGGRVVSSSLVREEILSGRVGSAARLLGRYHSISGTVVKGRGVGKGLGFPTANLKTPNELLPPPGVYAVYADVDGKRRRAVANIGTAPTFKGKRPVRIEVHVLNFSGVLYGERIEVCFKRRLRAEKVFSGKEALRERIKKDITRAKKILC